MEKIKFGSNVPHHVKKNVMDQIRAGETPLDVPEGYHMQADTGESALDVTVRIRKTADTE